jgi:hypothetical protein
VIFRGDEHGDAGRRAGHHRPHGVVTRTGNVATPFGPLSVTADGDVAVPLPALDAGSNDT